MRDNKSNNVRFTYSPRSHTMSAYLHFGEIEINNLSESRFVGFFVVLQADLQEIARKSSTP